MSWATESLAPVLEQVVPVGLEELNEKAALQTRTDRKYLVNPEAALDLVEMLRDQVKVLEIGGRRAFSYESVYFDTPDLVAYRLAARRRPTRFKVRTRTYTDSGECWLEVKTRDRRGRTVKHRQLHHPRQQSNLDERSRAFISGVLEAFGHHDVEESSLRPSLVTTYQRTTLHLPAEGSRVTIDTDLKCEQDGLEWEPGCVVVESKTVLHASNADRMLWRLGHRPVPISKYATGLAALNPTLPANRWLPILRQHPALPSQHTSTEDQTLPPVLTTAHRSSR